MSSENLSRVRQEIELKRADILSEFNRVLQEHHILGVAVVDFKVNEINDLLVEGKFRESVRPRWCLDQTGLCVAQVNPAANCQPCTGNLLRVSRETEPMLADILSKFNRVLQEHRILGVGVVEFKVKEITKSSAR